MANDEVLLLGKLGQALDAHDLPSLAQRWATALGEALPVSWVELVARDLGTDRLVAVLVDLRDRQPVVTARAVDQALLATLRSPTLLRMPPPRELAQFPEVARAQRAASLLFLPAHRRGESFGQLVVALGQTRFSMSDALLPAMAALISAGLANVGVVARLAQVSQRAYRQNRQLRDDLQLASAPPRLIGAAPPFRQALAAADAVAPYATPVLLRGESGTGKELFAMRVHERSPRARRPFLKVNCGAIPDGLVEGELFGHERGAFTGADRRHAGIFERASGGTVLLDEVAELSLSSQVKLLRVLQSGEFHRVGGADPLHADVRIIAASHRDLEQMVHAGDFRHDLLFRLDVFPIVIPPLRKRIEDIASLAVGLLGRLAARLGRSPVPSLDGRAIARLEAYAWPGNVRELENVLERGLILSPGSVLEIPDLSAPRAPARTGHDSLAAATRHHIETMLRTCDGKIYGADGAAARLGLPPSTLQSKMRRLGVSTSGRVRRAR